MSEEQVSLYMKCLGFRKLKDEHYGAARYLSDTVLAEDLHSSNIWLTEEDNVVMIDGAFFFNTPELGLGGQVIL